MSFAGYFVVGNQRRWKMCKRVVSPNGKRLNDLADSYSNTKGNLIKQLSEEPSFLAAIGGVTGLDVLNPVTAAYLFHYLFTHDALAAMFRSIEAQLWPGGSS